MGTKRKPKAEVLTQLVNFRAPQQLVDDFREVVNREERTVSQDLRRYMAERIAGGTEKEAA